MKASKALIITIDGLRPDALDHVDTPHMDSLMARGAWTMAAQSVMPTITLPTHTSMFFGSTPEGHGVEHNTWPDGYTSPMPSLFEVAAEAGLSTAAIYGWDNFKPMVPLESVDWADFNPAYEKDTLLTTRNAVPMIKEHAPDLMFLYMAQTDTDGHGFGWMSEGYLNAVKVSDEAVGMAIGALEDCGCLDETVIAVLADHGGHETKHGTDMPEDMLVPWFVAGPGIRNGYEIMGRVGLEDTAPTIASALGLPIPNGWTGKIIEQALEA